MSMYAQLLDAALEQRPTDVEVTSEHDALDEVLLCRRALEEGLPPDGDPDTVPVVLALQIAYDVALLELARVVGLDSDPSRFDQPERERDRLRSELHGRGISLEITVESDPVSERS